VLAANHFLISHAAGLLIIDETQVEEFKKLLVAYYEIAHPEEITTFLQGECYRPLPG